jgi:adenylate cyclase
MTVAEFETAGLYDPREPNAAERLALLEWLTARGVTREQLVRAHGQGLLTALAGMVALRPGLRLTLADVAKRAGIPTTRVEEIRFAAGLSPVDPAERVFSEEDAETFAIFAVGAAQFGELPLRRFVRVMGSALAGIAEAALSLFYVNVERPMHERNAGELALAEANLRAIQTLQVVPRAMAGLFVAHVEAAIERFRQARRSVADDVADFTVGFVDLVGYTTLSRRMTVSELAAVIDRFEDTAYEVATARGGRVVKLVGDEVMFVTVTAAAACDIALALLDHFAGDPSITPRGGLASGELLIRGGDYYGPVVNTAARLADLAVPHEVLATPEVAEQARGPGLRFEAAGRRLPKGFEAPLTLFTVERS